jgi:hypothetical protein
MGDLVNLRAARKRATRARHEEQAAQNRLRYGRTKAERELEVARSEKALRQLDAHRIEKGDGR